MKCPCGVNHRPAAELELAAPPIYNPANDVNCERCGAARWMHAAYWARTIGADHEFVEPAPREAP